MTDPTIHSPQPRETELFRIGGNISFWTGNCLELALVKLSAKRASTPAYERVTIHQKRPIRPIVEGPLWSKGRYRRRGERMAAKGSQAVAGRRDV